MNVIISNLNGDRFANLDIEVIKSITGEFTVEEIIRSFSNFFFNRMFLDVTAVKDYRNVNVFKSLSMELDMNKVILLLPSDNVVNSEIYISSLISMGIYNFAKNEDELTYLYNNPNSYKDVAHLQKIDESVVNNNDNEVGVSTRSNASLSNVKIIGVKNFTSHAGATSLIYMLKNQLSSSYYTVAIEINKRDFLFFNDKDMVSCKENEITDILAKYSSATVILIDLNDVNVGIANTFCNDIIYLMESSTLMINKAVMLNKNCFSNLSDKRVVLNFSLLSTKDVEQLQSEAGIRFFHVLPPLNDREDNSNVLVPFLAKFDLYKEV